MAMGMVLAPVFNDDGHGNRNPARRCRLLW
jgi:hypothetical protein